jgi:glycine reductase
MSKVRAMHFMNQFFAGLGGEEKADLPLDVREGTLGPGRRLQTLLGDSAEIAVTISCGDNYFPTHQDEVISKVIQVAKDREIGILFGGPAFIAGRYGFACNEVANAVSNSLSIYSIIAMHISNAGVTGYKEYKNRKVFCLPTSDSLQGMEDALSKMAQFVVKLIAGEAIGPASKEGYIPRGIRLTEYTDKTGAKRAVDMLTAKLTGCPFLSEIPFIPEEGVSIAPPIKDMKKAQIALVTTAGITKPGNPDGFKETSNTKWVKYSINALNAMTDAKWDVVHSGYNATWMKQRPDYGAPLDAAIELEKEGVFGKLFPYLYASSGAGGVTPVMQRIGSEIAADMKREHVDGAVLVST